MARLNLNSQENIKSFDQRHFMKKLAEIRKSKMISQENLSKEIGIHNSGINQLEKGFSIPQVEVICRLCEYFDVKPDFFIKFLEKS